MDILFANMILFFHLFYISYIIIGLLLIYLGYFLKWRFIRNPLFRWTHLAAMGIVIFETLFGIFCPLTEWEAALRRAAGESLSYSAGFIPYWIHRLFFYDWPTWVFSLIYGLFFLLMIATIFIIPIHHKKK